VDPPLPSSAIRESPSSCNHRQTGRGGLGLPAQPRREILPPPSRRPCLRQPQSRPRRPTRRRQSLATQSPAPQGADRRLTLGDSHRGARFSRGHPRETIQRLGDLRRGRIPSRDHWLLAPPLPAPDTRSSCIGPGPDGACSTHSLSLWAPGAARFRRRTRMACRAIHRVTPSQTLPVQRAVPT